MEYHSVSEVARMWQMSERTIRHYCSNGVIEGAQKVGRSWKIPSGATPPLAQKANHSALLYRLQEERSAQIKGGIYHKIHIELTYNSNRIEGSSLSEEETRYIFETNTVGVEGGPFNVDDIIETANHFRAIDFIIDRGRYELTESFIKKLHHFLKHGTSDSRKPWFATGEYKKVPNEVGGMNTTPPKLVGKEIGELLSWYRSLTSIRFDDILEFHVRFERIHPFQDGNGRVGRLIMFKECLAHNIVPFIISDSMKAFYYRGLQQWEHKQGFLRDTCLAAQDTFKEELRYFEIPFV